MKIKKIVAPPCPLTTSLWDWYYLKFQNGRKFLKFFPSIVTAPVVNKKMNTTLSYGVGNCQNLDENDYFGIESVDIHESYDSKSQFNDIAIITVDQTFDLQQVKPMKLAPTNATLGNRSM